MESAAACHGRAILIAILMRKMTKGMILGLSPVPAYFITTPGSDAGCWFSQ
jgi:hypothetical protein